MISNKIKILVADDKEVLRLGLVQLIENIADCQVLGEAKSGQETVDMAIRMQPDVVLIKQNILFPDGVKTTRLLKKHFPTARVIMLLSTESDFFSAVEAGADGYIMRETPEHLLAAAIQTVHQGLSWIGPFIARYLLHGDGLPVMRNVILAEHVNLPGLEHLSVREREVLRLLTDGFSNQQIANRLAIQLQTVKVHVRSILKKLNVRGRSEAIAKVLKTGLSIG
ncbi:MAG: response regulator transcription factor [Cyanobacteria bacterium]|nr:response regulator transcription factor [Cyanobacteriota bacterium]